MHSPSRPIETPTPEATSDLVVRRPRWDFAEDLDSVFADPDLAEACFRVAFSLTLPHLEPYLIRTYRGVVDELPDPQLAADVRAFCGQEAQHHRNHARANKAIRDHLGGSTAEQLVAIEDELEADYQRFTAERSLRFNTAYAEGFEAMTCAMALTMLEVRAKQMSDGASVPGAWDQLWAWHLGEEIEHRTVAFDVYHRLGGGYARRVATSVHAQVHYARYLDRLHRVLCHHHGLRRGPLPYVPKLLRAGRRRYLRTFRPSYDPAAIDVPPAVEELLARFSDTPGAPAAA